MAADSKIKIIQIIADSGLGGGPRHVLGLIKNIDKEKFDVFVICPSGYLSAEAKLLKDVKVFNLNFASKFDLAAIFKIKKIIGEIRAKSTNPFGPLIVHTHGSRAGFIGRIAAPIMAKKVHTEHIFDENYHLKNPLNEWIQKSILRKQNLDSDLIIAVSTSVKQFLIKSKMAPAEKIVIIPNGLPADAKAQLLQAGTEISSLKFQISNKSQKAPVIGTIGNLNFQKGQTYLIEAMAMVVKKYPLATLEIIGEGEDRKALEEQIKKLNLEKHVGLLGYKTDVEKYLSHWSVFVLPSISETFGIAILEAMKSGVPVVASKVGGVFDIITNEKNGLLVPPKNADKIAEKIIAILERPALAAKLKREGKERAKDFDWKKIIKKIEQKYLEIV